MRLRDSSVASDYFAKIQRFSKKEEKEEETAEHASRAHNRPWKLIPRSLGETIDEADHVPSLSFPQALCAENVYIIYSKDWLVNGRCHPFSFAQISSTNRAGGRSYSPTN